MRSDDDVIEMAACVGVILIGYWVAPLIVYLLS